MEQTAFMRRCPSIVATSFVRFKEVRREAKVLKETEGLRGEMENQQLIESLGCVPRSEGHCTPSGSGKTRTHFDLYRTKSKLERYSASRRRTVSSRSRGVPPI